jgi:uncharacterized protein
MKFIADVMLGRLATWLRLMGHDVLYDRQMEDRQIIRIAQEQGRTIITRDTGLLRHKAVRDCIFITSDHILEQLAEMKERLGCFDLPCRGRCARCNGELEEVGRNDDIRERVPDYIFHAYDQFLQCRTCRNVYWEGSHYRHMKEILQQVCP